MGEKMTLEQVRDLLREEVAILDKIGSNHATVHRGYMQAWAYAIDAHLAQPAQAVDVGAIREVIDDLREWGETDKQLAERAETLTRALAGEKVEGWVLVPREPTPEMIAACIAVWQERLRRKAENGTLLRGGNAEKSFRENWAAMVAASPDFDRVG